MSSEASLGLANIAQHLQKAVFPKLTGAPKEDSLEGPALSDSQASLDKHTTEEYTSLGRIPFCLSPGVSHPNLECDGFCKIRQPWFNGSREHVVS